MEACRTPRCSRNGGARIHLDNSKCHWQLLHNGGGVIFKYAVKKKRWNIERAWRGLFARGGALIKRIESARAKGFTTPMRIFLFAEKYHYGVVQERFLIAEQLDGVDLRSTWREHKEQMLKTVLAMHKHNLGWGGDANIGNFLLCKDGELRAIDLGFNKPSWLAKGKDLYCLDWLYAIRDGKFRLKVFTAKIQNRLKGSGPHGKNGAAALAKRLKEDEELKNQQAHNR